MTRDVRRRGFLLACLAPLLCAGPAGAHETQRMVLPPACFEIGPGGFYEASAYCLDKDLPAPGAGEILAGVPAGFGDMRIKSARGVATLQAALAGHLIRIEGLGADDYQHVRILNLTGRTLEICSTRPSIVAGDADATAADVAKVYPDIVALLKHGGAGPVESPESHAATQDRLWRIVQDRDFDDWWAKLTHPADGAPDAGSGRGQARPGCVSSSGPTAKGGTAALLTYCPP